MAGEWCYKYPLAEKRFPIPVLEDAAVKKNEGETKPVNSLFRAQVRKEKSGRDRADSDQGQRTRTAQWPRGLEDPRELSQHVRAGRCGAEIRRKKGCGQEGFAPRGHPATSGDMLGCHNWEMTTDI